MATQVQALLDELKVPTHATTTAAESSMLNLLSSLDALKNQGTRYGNLVGPALVAETDAELRSRLELYRQTALAMQDRLAQMDALANEVVAIFRQMDRYDSEIRPVAVGAGYEG